VVDHSRTLDELEGVDWAEPDFASYLVQTIHALRRIPISEFTIEDLRITLGQQIGVEHLTPLALDRLDADPFAEGDYYPGDLLGAVMSLPREYWQQHPTQAARMATIADRTARLLEHREEIDEIKVHLRDLIAVQAWRTA
jgi:hypothetical protein